MNAAELLDKKGDLLIDREVITLMMGDWPGGVARVIELRPDEAAPEIVFQVSNGVREIGVFDHEDVQLVEGRFTLEAGKEVVVLKYAYGLERQNLTWPKEWVEERGMHVGEMVEELCGKVEGAGAKAAFHDAFASFCQQLEEAAEEMLRRGRGEEEG